MPACPLRRICEFSSLAALLGGFAVTETPAAELRPTVRLGGEFGGDKVATVVYTDGSSTDLRAGTGLVLAAGASLLNDTKDLELEVTAGIKVQMVNAKNADITWRRFPLEALVFYRYARVRFGGGLAWHLAPKISGSGAANNVNATFDNALGLVVQCDFLFSGAESGSGAYVGARFSTIKYESETAAFNPSGNSIGIHAGYRF